MKFELLNAVAELLLYNPVLNEFLVWEVNEDGKTGYMLPATGLIIGRPVQSVEIIDLVTRLKMTTPIKIEAFYQDMIEAGETVKQTFIAELDISHTPDATSRIHEKCDCGKCDNREYVVTTLFINEETFKANLYQTNVNYDGIFNKLRNCYLDRDEKAIAGTTTLINKLMNTSKA